MKISVDLELCQGYLNCMESSPQLFDINDATGQAIVLDDDPDESMKEAAQEAVQVCPARAILLS